MIFVQILIILGGLGFITKVNTTNCTTNTDCNKGQCVSSACVCNAGYINFPSNQVCNYEQKSKETAFLLSFFFGYFGADWFYLSKGNGGLI